MQLSFGEILDFVLVDNSPSHLMTCIEITLPDTKLVWI